METNDRWFIHAGTRRAGESLVTDGGRVGAVVARGDTAPEARRAAYEGVTHVQWEGMTHRSDIGVTPHG
jgi:phosphoribosylamine--glycine ligase